MRIIERPRQWGKTTTIVDWVRGAPNRIIVTFNERERDRLIRTYGLKAEQVWTWNSNTPRMRGCEVAIDNLDLILQQVYGDVKVVTLTEES